MILSMHTQMRFSKQLEMPMTYLLKIYMLDPYGTRMVFFCLSFSANKVANLLFFFFSPMSVFHETSRGFFLNCFLNSERVLKQF